MSEVEELWVQAGLLIFSVGSVRVHHLARRKFTYKNKQKLMV